MKVLMTCDTIGGVWTYAIDLAKGLVKHDVQIALASMGAPLTDDQKSQVREAENIELYESAYALEWMENPWDDVRRAGNWLLEINSNFRADVVHLNGYCHARLDFGSPKLLVGHSCVASWWKAVKGERLPSEWSRYTAEVTTGLNSADLVAAPTQAMLSDLRTEYTWTGCGLVIPNGRDSLSFQLSMKEPLIFSAGRMWDEAKNLRALLSLSESIEWPIVVAGAQDLQNVPSGIFSLGRLGRASMADWLDRASIYCLPAKYEPFGLSILEAALSGCVLVVGDLPSLHEVWGDAAIYIDPDDHEALKSELKSLIADDVRREEMSHRAAHRARQFSLAAMAHNYSSAYESLIGESI